MIVDGRHLSESNPLLKKKFLDQLQFSIHLQASKTQLRRQMPQSLAWVPVFGQITIKHYPNAVKKINCGSIALNKNVHSAFDTPFGLESLWTWLRTWNRRLLELYKF